MTSLLFALLALTALAQDDESTREADLFGGESADDDREQDLFGEASPQASNTAEAILDKIAEADETFTVGGRLWLQIQGQLDQDTEGPEDVALSSPNLLDLFGDARPNDRVRAYARMRLTHDWTVHDTLTTPAGERVDAVTGLPVETNPFGATAQQDTLVLDQLWIKLDAGHKVYTTVGRQRIKWGASRYWNPTDFLNQQRLDPLAVLDLRNGVSLVKVHVPFESAGGNLYAIANLDQANALDQVGGAFRAEWLVGQTEATVSTAVRKDQPLRLGADLSSGISILDVRLEAALLHGNAAPSWRGRWDYSELPPVFPGAVDRDDDWIPQVVAGADLTARYNDQDTVSFGLEYFWNDAGYADADLYPWLFLTSTYSPLYAGRHYLAASALLIGPGQWDDHSFAGSYIANLSDGSNIARVDYRGRVLTWLDVNLFVANSFGANGELHYRTTLPRMPDEVAALCVLDATCAPYADLLSERIDLPAPTVSLGGGMAVRF